MLIPKWSQTLFRNRDSPHMGIFKSTCLFTYGNHHIEMVNPYGKTFPFGDFLINPQTVTNSISEWVSDWTVPAWKRAISWNWFQNGFSKWYCFPIRWSRYGNGEPYVLNPVSIWGFSANRFCFVILMWKGEAVCFESPYWNSDSPFPNGDLPFPISQRCKNVGFSASDVPTLCDLMGGQNYSPHFHTGTPLMEMCR